jgi:hypothetical protein
MSRSLGTSGRSPATTGQFRNLRWLWRRRHQQETGAPAQWDLLHELTLLDSHIEYDSSHAAHPTRCKFRALLHTSIVGSAG